METFVYPGSFYGDYSWHTIYADLVQAVKIYKSVINERRAFRQRQPQTKEERYKFLDCLQKYRISVFSLEAIRVRVLDVAELLGPLHHHSNGRPIPVPAKYGYRLCNGDYKDGAWRDIANYLLTLKKYSKKGSLGATINGYRITKYGIQKPEKDSTFSVEPTREECEKLYEKRLKILWESLLTTQKNVIND